jgi:RNA polymerase sigma factor (sigma-70 family)
VEELLQDAFVIGFESVSSGRYDECKAPLYAYLYGIARNLVREIIRLQQREPFSLDDLGDAQVAGFDTYGDLEDILYLEELRCQLLEALNHLPERHRCIVQAFYVQASSAHEVSERLNLSPENVRMIAHRGVSKIGTYLASKHHIFLSADAIRLGLETGPARLESEGNLRGGCALDTTCQLAPVLPTMEYVSAG